MSGKKNRVSISDRIRRFEELAGRIDMDGIRELGKSDPQAAYYAAQQMEQQLQQQQKAAKQQAMQAQAEAQQQQAQGLDLGGSSEGKPEDEMNSEKALQLQAELPFKKQLANVQQLMIDLENQLRQKHSSTPAPGSM